MGGGWWRDPRFSHMISHLCFLKKGVAAAAIPYLMRVATAPCVRA